MISGDYIKEINTNLPWWLSVLAWCKCQWKDLVWTRPLSLCTLKIKMLQILSHTYSLNTNIQVSVFRFEVHYMDGLTEICLTSWCPFTHFNYTLIIADLPLPLQSTVVWKYTIGTNETTDDHIKMSTSVCAFECNCVGSLQVFFSVIVKCEQRCLIISLSLNSFYYFYMLYLLRVVLTFMGWDHYCGGVLFFQLGTRLFTSRCTKHTRCLSVKAERQV